MRARPSGRRARLRAATLTAALTVALVPAGVAVAQTDLDPRKGLAPGNNPTAGARP